VLLDLAVHLQVHPALAAAFLGAAPPSILWDVVDGALTKTAGAALFSNERFATVKPRLVAGRFIRKWCSLLFVEGVCVW